MDYTAAAPPAADSHPAYAHPYAYPYTYPVYHQPDPAAAAAAAASSSSYYYANPTDTQAQYNPYATYQYYGAQAVDTGGSGLAEYYFTAGEASHAPAVSAAQVAPAATGRQAEKNFGFDPQRYAQPRTRLCVDGPAMTLSSLILVDLVSPALAHSQRSLPTRQHACSPCADMRHHLFTTWHQSGLWLSASSS